MNTEEEELLKLIELASKEVPPPVVSPKKKKKVDDGLTEAQRFCIALGIKDGRNKVPIRCLWESYKEWATRPIPKRTFTNQLSSLFLADKKASYRFYRLNFKAWEIGMKVVTLKETNEIEKEEQKKK